MKTQESDSVFDKLIDKAIGDDLKQKPNIFHVQKIMSTVYSISKNKNVLQDLPSKQNSTFRLALIYGVSIAASVCIGYFIGSLNINPSDSTMMMVNFENTNFNSLLSF